MSRDSGDVKEGAANQSQRRALPCHWGRNSAGSGDFNSGWSAVSLQRRWLLVGCRGQEVLARDGGHTVTVTPRALVHWPAHDWQLPSVVNIKGRSPSLSFENTITDWELMVGMATNHARSGYQLSWLADKTWCPYTIWNVKGLQRRTNALLTGHIKKLFCP